MEFHLNAAHVLSAEPSLQYSTSYQYSGEAAIVDPRAGMGSSQYSWDYTPPAHPCAGSTTPCSTEAPQDLQILTSYIPPVLWPYSMPSLPSGTSVVDLGNGDRVGVGHNATQEDQARNRRLARERSKHPAKRRALTSKKNIQLDVLRRTLGAGPGSTKLEVLNMAIERLGGHEARTEALAYRELHRFTGEQGRLKHVECLQAVDDALNGRPVLAIRHHRSAYPPDCPPGSHVRDRSA